MTEQLKQYNNMPRGKRKVNPGSEIIITTVGEDTKIEEVNETIKTDGCPNCGGPTIAYVVANGKRFCSDKCVGEYLNK